MRTYANYVCVLPAVLKSRHGYFPPQHQNNQPKFWAFVNSSSCCCSCEKISCDRQGMTHDYRKKGGLMYSGILAPINPRVTSFYLKLVRCYMGILLGMFLVLIRFHLMPILLLVCKFLTNHFVVCFLGLGLF
jgi:hypothetical protein